MISRADLVAEALRWIGTPFHAGQRCRGVGADCIGVVSGVAEASGISHTYRNDYGLRPDGTMRAELLARMMEVAGPPLPGDVLLLRMIPGAPPHHVAIYVGGGEIVHAYVSARRCVRQPYDAYWIGRTVAVYRWPGVDDVD